MLQPNSDMTIRDGLLALVTSVPTAYATGQWISLSRSADEALLIAAQLKDEQLWSAEWHDEFLQGFTRGMR